MADEFNTRKWFKNQYLEEAGIKEGIWKVGTEEQIQHFINDIEKIKTHYYSIVGSDAVFNGLDQAIMEAEELKDIARGDYKHHTKV